MNLTVNIFHGDERNWPLIMKIINYVPVTVCYSETTCNVFDSPYILICFTNQTIHVTCLASLRDVSDSPLCSK